MSVRNPYRKCHQSFLSASVGADRMARARVRLSGTMLRSRNAQVRRSMPDACFCVIV